MKKIILTLAIFIISSHAFSQWNITETSMTTAKSVGIGALNPNYKLDVAGNIHSDNLYVQSPNAYVQLGDIAGSMFLRMNNQGNLQITNSYKTPLYHFDQSGKLGIGIFNPQYSLDVAGNIHSNNLYLQSSNAYIQMGDITGSMFLRMNNSGNMQITNSSLISLYHFDQSGKLGIGTVTPKEMLDVAGTIRAKEVKIEINAGADHVFNHDYDLKPLSEVEHFIKTNKHLPEVPSEKQMQAEGLNINEFQIKLLQKIEELTLYVIQQEKKNRELEKEIKNLKSNLSEK